jgi:hypothetical protein
LESETKRNETKRNETKRNETIIKTTDRMIKRTTNSQEMFALA